MPDPRPLLISFGLDGETVEFLAVALEDAEPEERQEVLEPFLTPEQINAVLEAFPSAGGPQPTTRSDVGVGVDLAHKVQAEHVGVAEASETEAHTHTTSPPPEHTEDKKGGPKLRKDGNESAKKSALKKEAGSRKGTGGPVIEVTCKVSRFHADTFDHKFQGINIEGVNVAINGRDLIQDVDLIFSAGERYGLLGQNGAGKSTLLRAMADGSIPAWPRNCRALLVDQDDVGDERSSLEVVMSAAEEIVKLKKLEALLAKVESADEAKRALLEVAVQETAEALRLAALYAAKLSRQRGKAAAIEELKARRDHEDAKAAAAASGDSAIEGTAEDLQEVAVRLAQVREQLQVLNADALEGKARRVLQGLGFSDETMQQRTDLLSGGWRMRTALARGLVAEPDVMLLDEPTNHLDWPALLWFENYLRTLDNIVLIIVSHDRYFLDEVATQIVRLSGGGLQYFVGNYTAFSEALEQEKLDKANYAEKRQEKIDKEWEKVRRMEVEGRRNNNSSLLAQVSSRKKKLGVGTSHGVCRVGATRDVNGKAFKIFSNTFDTVDHGESHVTDDAQVKLNLSVAGSLGFDGAFLQCRQLQFGYDKSKPFSQPFDLDIKLNSRIAFLGMNGSGKTTLIRTMAQELRPLHGEVYVYPRLVVSYFSQHVADSLPLDRTPCESLKELFPEATDQQIRAQLGSFGIRSQATVPLGCLSGGEKARCSLASITFKPPHILLFDEPTNHLDLNTVEALATALSGFGGGIVLVSHDRRLIEALNMECYMLHEGKLSKSSLKDFLRAVRRRQAAS